MSTDETDTGDRVEDEETLYRSIRLQSQNFKIDAGRLIVSPVAFADRQKQPSLYRHHLCDNPPTSDPPRKGPDQSVVSLIAGDIRQEGPIEHKSGKEETVKYIVDVKPDTSGDQHRAHAIVFATPDFTNSRPFEKLTIRLARLAHTWAICPEDNFIEQLRREQR